MKKLICVALTVALLLGMVVTAQAKTVEIPREGLTLEVPDNFEDVFGDLQGTDTLLMFQGAADDPARYEFVMTEGEEQYLGRWMEELSEDECEALFEKFSADMYQPDYEMKELGDLDWMIITEGNSCEVIYLTLIYGSMTVVGILRVDGEALTTDQLAVAEQMANSIAVKAMPPELQPEQP